MSSSSLEVAYRDTVGMNQHAMNKKLMDFISSCHLVIWKSYLLQAITSAAAAGGKLLINCWIWDLPVFLINTHESIFSQMACWSWTLAYGEIGSVCVRSHTTLLLQRELLPARFLQ
eukprot:scaffold60734_cov59-Attheya_sp.AAC.1